MFRYLVKKCLNLAELSNHSSIIKTIQSSGLYDPGAFRRYGAAAVPEEDSEEARIPRTKYGTLRRRQVEAETEAWEKAADEYRELVATMCEKKLAPNLPYVKGLLLGWFEPLRDAIAEAQKKGTKKKGCRNTYARYLVALPADMTAVIAMHKLLALIMNSNGFVRIAQASIQIGEAVEHEARILSFLDKTKKAEIDNNDKQKRLRKAITELLGKSKVNKARKIVKQQDRSKPWGLEGQLRAGSRLIELLMETAFIQPPVRQLGDFPPDLRPAFIHNIRADPKTGKGIGVIECDPLVLSGLQNTARHMVNPVIPYMPMLVPPKKWAGYDKGAHLYLPSYVVRTHGSKQQRQLIKRAPRNQLKLVYEALDTLGSTRWRVNNRMLGIIDTIWSSGGALAGLVSRNMIPLPVKPDIEDESEIHKWWGKVKSVKKDNKERHSQQCDIELRLSAARKMKDEECFYYPHNLDFRGRAYPMHPYLNHLGSDLSRGILEFAEGRPLGKSGLRWLKIHLASLYSGVDKLSHGARVTFTEDHISDIFDSADRPLEGKRWWMESEDPFQCLATCMNLAEALRSPSPETSISHMPVHQDGSCNGLQHYAALGRDKVGAAAVNLVAGEKPVDVYAGVASRVLDVMREDAMDDLESNPNASHARRLIDQVDRKLVKQTVMTSVYGVTYTGARDQIQKRLKERDAIPDNSELFAVSSYAAKTVRLAIGEMFEAAKSIMAWLSDCAKVIASDNKAVQWTTPVGLPVVQPYRKFGTRRVKTTLHSLSLKTETDKIMASRQRSAFPPNFVHSLDGSHMMMTALACSKAGLNFAGVHDSYWTHACDVDTMNEILREKFVQLYEAPILENLLESFEKTYPNLKFPPLPDQGDFDLREVLNSPYFFN